MPVDRRGLRAELQVSKTAEGGGEASSASPKSSRRGRGRGKGKGGEAKADVRAAEEPAEAAPRDEALPTPAEARRRLEGVPWELLPCEVPLSGQLRALAAAETAEARDAALLEVLRAHPFVEATGPPGGRPATQLGDRLGSLGEEHFRMQIREFNRWLKTPEGRPFAKLAGGPTDDGIYTVSAVMRHCMPRGLSRFTFGAAPGQEVIVRGFRKFTGLTADDEDEESGATNMYEDFYYTKDASAERFAVTTKSNGENGKFAVRRVAGEQLIFAGSKNRCLSWQADQDVAELHPSEDPSIPGPLIAAKMQGFWRGWEQGTREDFAERVGEGGWTLMLEHNCAHHEHVFPIPQDFVEFVAVLDREGLPLPQKQAFALFDEFGLPRVRCEEGVPMAMLPERLAAERAAVDREGAVLYLEAAGGVPVGLLKVKSDFYVRARRTRQIFWSAITTPLLRGDDVEGPEVGNSRRSGQGFQACEKRLRVGMRQLRHVEGCDQSWEDWAEAAVGFLRWWRASKYDKAVSADERKQLAQESKQKFGSLYRDYCRSAGLPGGEN